MVKTGIWRKKGWSDTHGLQNADWQRKEGSDKESGVHEASESVVGQVRIEEEGGLTPRTESKQASLSASPRQRRELDGERRQ